MGLFFGVCSDGFSHLYPFPDTLLGRGAGVPPLAGGFRLHTPFDEPIVLSNLANAIATLLNLPVVRRFTIDG
jgi:hypothetical protein